MSNESDYLKELKDVKQGYEKSSPIAEIKFPRPVIGLVASIAFILIIIGAIIFGALGQEAAMGMMMGLAIFFAFFCVIYFLTAVYGLHSALAQATNGTYPITPGRALGFHFIPFYNFYWICKWPYEISRFVNTLEKKQRLSPGLFAFGMLMSVLSSRIGIGLVLEMSLLLNLVRRSREAVANEEALNEYRASNKKMKALPVWAVLVIFIGIFALLAAIAVPNFIQARNAARKRVAAGLPVSSSSSLGAIDKFNSARKMVRNGMSPEEASKRVVYGNQDRSLDSYYEELGVQKDQGNEGGQS